MEVTPLGPSWLKHFQVYPHKEVRSLRFVNPIYTTEKIGKARMKIGKGNFHFRQGKRKMCSLHTSVLPLLVLF